MLRDHADELRVQAPAAALEATLAATRSQLRERSARVAIEGGKRTENALAFEVHLENLTGHKLPTAHPTRRAWLRVAVRDDQGVLLFVSGDTDARGRILGADGEPLPSELGAGPIEPHRDVVRTPDQVALYHAVMADAQGTPTHTLLRGATWLHDNRLLPHGWSSSHPDAARTVPVGVDADADFTAGGDRVRFELALATAGPVTIEAALLYQPLSARWAAELLRWRTPELEAFRRMYAQAELAPERLAEARCMVE